MKWLDTKEYKPEHGQRIAILRPDGEPFAGEYCGKVFGGRCVNRKIGQWYNFRYWLELPPPPGADDAG